MFASNFPVAGLKIGYRAQIAARLKSSPISTGPSSTGLFRDNARRFYRIA